MNKLIAFLLDHAILDFSGELTVEMVKDFLREDDNPSSRALAAKLSKEGAVDDMMVTLADCLQEYIRTGVTEDVVRDQIKMYAES